MPNYLPLGEDSVKMGSLGLLLPYPSSPLLWPSHYSLQSLLQLGLGLIVIAIMVDGVGHDPHLQTAQTGTAALLFSLPHPLNNRVALQHVDEHRPTLRLLLPQPQLILRHTLRKADVLSSVGQLIAAVCFADGGLPAGVEGRVLVWMGGWVGQGVGT